MYNIIYYMASVKALNINWICIKIILITYTRNLIIIML